MIHSLLIIFICCRKEVLIIKDYKLSKKQTNLDTNLEAYSWS